LGIYKPLSSEKKKMNQGWFHVHTTWDEHPGPPVIHSMTGSSAGLLRDAKAQYQYRFFSFTLKYCGREGLLANQ
jgi:hypothetical protein